MWKNSSVSAASHPVLGCLPLCTMWRILLCSEPKATHSSLFLCSTAGSKPRIFSIVRPVTIISRHVPQSHQEASYPAHHIPSRSCPCPELGDMNCSWNWESPHLNCKSRSLWNTMATSWSVKSWANLTDIIVFQFQICTCGTCVVSGKEWFIGKLLRNELIRCLPKQWLWSFSDCPSTLTSTSIQNFMEIWAEQK